MKKNFERNTHYMWCAVKRISLIHLKKRERVGHCDDGKLVVVSLCRHCDEKLKAHGTDNVDVNSQNSAMQLKDMLNLSELRNNLLRCQQQSAEVTFTRHQSTKIELQSEQKNGLAASEEEKSTSRLTSPGTAQCGTTSQCETKKNSK